MNASQIDVECAIKELEKAIGTLEKLFDHHVGIAKLHLNDAKNCLEDNKK